MGNIVDLLQTLEPIDRFPIHATGRVLLQVGRLLPLNLDWRNDLLFIYPAQWTIEWPGIPEQPGIGITWTFGNEIAIIPIKQDLWQETRARGAETIIALIHQRTTSECLDRGKKLFKAYTQLIKYMAEKYRRNVFVDQNAHCILYTTNTTWTSNPIFSCQEDTKRLSFELQNACFLAKGHKKITTIPYTIEANPTHNTTAHNLLKGAAVVQKSFQKLGYDVSSIL